MTKATLRDYWEQEPRAETELRGWLTKVSLVSWSTPADVKQDYGTASILKDGRVVFNICGNKYRLVVKINYKCFILYVRFIGTHPAYDMIDAQTI